jgi:hypothetical protein
MLSAGTRNLNVPSNVVALSGEVAKREWMGPPPAYKYVAGSPEQRNIIRDDGDGGEKGTCVWMSARKESASV